LLKSTPQSPFQDPNFWVFHVKHSLNHSKAILVLTKDMENEFRSTEAYRGNPDKGKIPHNVIVLGIVSLFTDAASEMIYPAYPHIYRCAGIWYSDTGSD